MANTPLNIAPDQYETTYTHIFTRTLQEDMSLMENLVTLTPNCRGTAVKLPSLGKLELKQRKSRGEIVIPEEIKTGNRFLKPRLFQQHVHLYKDDDMFMGDLQLAVSNVINELRPAAKRKMDQVILGVEESADGSMAIVSPTASLYDGIAGGILGKNYTGVDGSTLVDLDPKMTVPEDFIFKGTKTATGMTIDKIVRLKQLLTESKAWCQGSPDQICMAITPMMLAELQMMEQTQNKNFGFSCLVDGVINKMLGINFMVTDLLPKEGNNRVCCAWMKSRIKLGRWDDARVVIKDRPEIVNIKAQVSLLCAYGAARMEEESVVKVLCAETAPTA